MPRALVMFTDEASHRLSPLLKRGFRHCFMAVDDGDFWVVIDGVAGVPFIKVPAASAYDLRAFYEAEGLTVVEADQRDVAPSGPLALANCVGLVKAMLAIDAPWVWTPWQLYKHLTRTT